MSIYSPATSHDLKSFDFTDNRHDMIMDIIGVQRQLWIVGVQYGDFTTHIPKNNQYEETQVFSIFWQWFDSTDVGSWCNKLEVLDQHSKFAFKNTPTFHMLLPLCDHKRHNALCDPCMGTYQLNMCFFPHGYWYLLLYLT